MSTVRHGLIAAAVWLAAGVLAAAGAVVVAIHVTASNGLRVVLALLLVAFSTLALMLSSDSAERWLDRHGRRWAWWLEWLTTAIVALAVVVVIGAPVTSLAPDRPGLENVAIDFLIDGAVGALAGVIAGGLILASSAWAGRALQWAHERLGAHERAARWRTPSGARAVMQGTLARAAALGAAGLLLSALWTALITTVTTNHTGAVDAPAPRETSAVLMVAVPVLLWFAGTGAGWLWFGRRHVGRHGPHRRLRHATHASALTICLVLAAAWFASADLESTARTALWSGARSAVPAMAVTPAQAAHQSPYLAAQFAPALRLTSDERWEPTAVDWYVSQNAKPNIDPPFCNARAGTAPPAGCYQLPPPCDDPDPGPCAPRGADAPAVYYRYVDATSADRSDRSPPASAGAWTVIQYWIFYNYDSLGTWALTQWHQSDWEQVSVLVRRSGGVVRPVEVAFSEHCYGARLPAERVWWSGSHPVVFVARGSHANYPRPVRVPVRQLRCSLGVTPRYLGVASLFFSPAVDGSRLEIPVAYLGGLRDDADGTRTPPVAPKLIALDSVAAIRSFTGNWGLDNNLSPFGLGRLRGSAGPPAPQTQGPWRMPFRAMLCSGSWLSVRARPPSETAWACRSR